jgi:cytochrome c peroxidase
MFWDGRADTLQQQAFGPLLNPVEMANASIDDVARKLAQSPHRARFEQLFGPRVFASSQLVVSEAMFAIARYQVEDRSFHPYDSKYDRWLEGRARLTQTELRGLRLFNDPAKANCAGCHLSQPGKDGLPPMFTDYQYEALGVPRNRALAANRNPAFHDLGVCGPFRDDLKDQTQYCGMFLTPTLRNAATRQVFFHNGVFHTLDQVMAFYNERSIAPQKFYPRGADGKVDEYDDIPPQYRANVDVTDAPFDRKPGDRPAMTEQDIKDIEAFLGTLTDAPQQQAAPRRRRRQRHARMQRNAGERDSSAWSRSDTAFICGSGVGSTKRSSRQPASASGSGSRPAAGATLRHRVSVRRNPTSGKPNRLVSKYAVAARTLVHPVAHRMRHREHQRRARPRDAQIPQRHGEIARSRRRASTDLVEGALGQPVERRREVALPPRPRARRSALARARPSRA